MNLKPKLAIILGTRPEIIKFSPIIRECEKQKINYFIIHTNQHYSSNMDKVFFEELELPLPTYNLDVRENLHGKMTARMLEKIEEILIDEKPTYVLVQGDTNSALAGALAGAKLNLNVGHVEAGLRSYDRTMPEEINRVLIDHVSTALFAPTEKQKKILLNEGINQKIVFVTGNTIVDAVYQNRKIANKHLEYDHYKNKRYALLTLHRPANVDEEIIFKRIMKAVTLISLEHDLTIYFPIHPRTKKNLSKFNIEIDEKRIKLLEPVGYLEMLVLEQHAKVILTDSGGLQEEACILGIPCITLRDNTERPETVDVGANVLVGSDGKKIFNVVIKSLNKKALWIKPFGDGFAGVKILKHII